MNHTKKAKAPITTRTYPLLLPRADYLTITTRPAELLETEQHRYVLARMWARTRKGLLGFVGMNPSAATAEENDATVRRCEKFAHTWGFDGFVMTNVISLRATSPKDMEAYLVDPDLWVRNEVNLDQIMWGLTMCREVILCCGRPNLRKQALAAFTAEIPKVLERLARQRHLVKCLGLTKDGYPKHPLYLSKNVLPEPLPLHLPWME